MRLLFYWILFMFTYINTTIGADDVILLDPQAPRATVFEVPLVGYKKFPEELFAVQNGRNFGLPTELIYASAAKIPEIEAAAAALGKEVFDLDIAAIVALVRSKYSEVKTGQQGVGRPQQRSFRGSELQK